MLRAASENADVREAALSLERAEAQVSGARSAYDPQYAVSLGAEASESQGFIAGYPSTAEATTLDGSASLSGATSWGGGWSVSAGLEKNDSTTTASFGGGAAVPQEVSTWGPTVSVGLDQDVLAFLRTSASAISVREARERLERSQIDALQTTESAVVATASAWWTWWGATAEADVAARSVEQSAALLDSTRARHEEGSVARLEVDRVEAEHLAAERDLLSADAEARAAGQALLVLLRLPHLDAIEPQGTERAVPTLGSGAEEDAFEVAQEGNLALAGLRSDLAAAKAAAADARDSGLPAATLSLEVGTRPLDPAFVDAVSGLGSASNPYGSLGLTVSGGVGGRAARAASSEAAATVMSWERRVDEQERQLASSVSTGLDTLRTSERAVELAEARLAVSLATEDAEQARVDEGLIRLDQLLETIASRQSAEADVVRAKVDRARAELELAQLEGRLLGEVLHVD